MRIRWTDTGFPTSQCPPPEEHGAWPSSPATDGRCLLTSPTVARWRLRWSTKTTGSASPPDGRSVRYQTAVLVRPDGYVAWATSRADINPDELRELHGVLMH